MRNRKSKLIAFLFVALVFMGIGYAALQTNLNIGGTAKASGTFNVEIFSITETQDSISNGGVTTKSATRNATNTEATFDTTFVKPGDYVEYKVTIKNTGTIDAVIDMEIDDSDNEDDGQGNDIFLFDVKDDTTEHKIKKNTTQNIILEAGQSRVFTVKISFNSRATTFPSQVISFVLTTEARQRGSETISDLIEDETTGWDYELDSEGTIIAYNPETVIDENGYAVVGATNYKGEQIKKIDSLSFYEKNVVAYLDSNYQPVAILIYYEEGTPEFNAALNLLVTAMSDEDDEEEGVANRNIKINPSKLLNSNKKPQVKRVRVYGMTVTDEISYEYAMSFMADINNNTFDDASLGISKLDLSRASNLEEIGAISFNEVGLLDLKLPTIGALTTIGYGAFTSNNISGEIIIPSSVTSIGNYAFSSNQISTLNLSNATSLETIGECAFLGNQISGTLTIPSSVTSIEEGAFLNNQLSGTLVIPSSVTSIGVSAFGNNQISTLNLSNATSLETIGNSAFSYNQLSGTLTIPSSVTGIGNGAFEGSGDGSTNQISTLNLSNATSLETIGESAFYGNQISTLNLSGATSLDTIGDYAFGYNQLSGTLGITSSVKSIGDGAFDGTSDGSTNQINTLNLSNATSLETIGKFAFRYNQLSGTLVIPSSVTSIGRYAFEGSGDGSTNQLTGLNLSNATSLETIGAYAFLYNQLTGTLTIPSSVTSIGYAAFEGSGDGSTNQISTLDLSNATSLETIGERAFVDNQLTGTLTIPSSVTSIGAYAFEGSGDGSTNQLTGLNLSNATSLETIGAYAFLYNQLTGTLTIPSSVTSIGYAAFEDNQINTLNLSNATSLEVIGTGAFSSNQLSGTLTIPSSVTSIGGSAFGHNQICTLNLNNATSLETIGLSAFDDNQLSGTVTIPSSVTNIGDYAFYNNQISTLNLSNAASLETICSSAFENNQLSGIITIPSSVTSIGYNAFINNKIEVLNIGSGLTSLGTGAFESNYDSTLQQYTLTAINIAMTQATWNSRNLPTTDWYSGSPTVTYNQP